MRSARRVQKNELPHRIFAQVQSGPTFRTFANWYTHTNSLHPQQKHFRSTCQLRNWWKPCARQKTLKLRTVGKTSHWNHAKPLSSYTKRKLWRTQFLACCITPDVSWRSDQQRRKLFRQCVRTYEFCWAGYMFLYVFVARSLMVKHNRRRRQNEKVQIPILEPMTQI